MDLRRVVRNVSSQWIAQVITAAAGIFMPPFLVHHLGAEGYGVHNLIGDLGGYASMLYFGLGAAVLKFVAEHRARDEQEALNETVSTIFAVYLRLGLLCLGLTVLLTVPLPRLFGLSVEISDAARIRLMMTGAAILAEFSGSVYGGVLMGLQRFDVLNALKLALLLARNVAIVAVVFWSPTVVAVGAVTLSATLIEQLVMRHVAQGLMPGLRVSLSLYRPARLRQLFNFSAQSFLFTMSDRLINYTDNILIAQAHGAVAGTVYSFPLRLVEFARETLDRAAHVLMPGFSELAAKGELASVRALWRTGNKLLTVLALPVALVQVCWGDHVLALWLSRTHDPEAPRIVTQGYACLVWLSLAFVMQLAGRGMARPLFEGMGELKWPARIAVLEALANVSMSLVLVRSWGLEGVAFATFLPSAVTGLVVMPWYACKRLEMSYGRHFIDTYVRVLPPLIPAFGVLWLAEHAGWHASVPMLAVTCLAVLVVYLAGASLVAFDRAERATVIRRLRVR